MTTFTPPTPAVLEPTRARGGLLAAALTAPEGWEQGLQVPFYGCGEPIVRNKCITAEDEAHRPNVGEFPSFPIEQGSTCSTLSRLPHDQFALGRLDATTEWALGRQLQSDLAETGAPKLDDGTNLGLVELEPLVVIPFAMAFALGCLEQAAADTGFGERVWIHTTVKGATWLGASSLIDANGFTPAGSRIVISPGYQNPSEEAIRFWATGSVWAAVSSAQVMEGTDWRKNDATAYALRAGIVAFDPCINLSIDVHVPACPVPDESPADSPAESPA